MSTPISRVPQAGTMCSRTACWAWPTSPGSSPAGCRSRRGGGRRKSAHEAVVTYEQGRELINSLSINVNSGIVAHCLLGYGSEAQKRHWLRKLATGELVAAVAISEPGAGRDLQAV